MSLTSGRNTPRREAREIAVLMAAGVTFYEGAMVCLEDGYAVPGKTSTDIQYLGRAEVFVDNADGDDGDQTVVVNLGDAFQWKNDTNDAVTQAHVGSIAYIVDDETVSSSDASGTRSPAGIIIQVDDDGVWIAPGLSLAALAAVDTAAAATVAALDARVTVLENA